MKKEIISCLGSGLFCFLALPVQAETVLEKIQRTGVLNIAIREDAAPFGYIDANNNLQGYCLGFFSLLEKQLVKTLERNTVSIKLLKSTTNNRFSLVKNDIVVLECGPNTIREDIPDNTAFSTAFFVTGTQFLVNHQNRDRLNLDSSLKDIKLGVIQNTTTEEIITETYPLAVVQKFSGVTARNRGVQAVEQGKIDAMISDGILLRAAAQQQELSAREYPLIPETPLTCDRYGMIINGKDPQWKEFVDSLIDSPKVANLSQAWFGELFNYGLIESVSCPKN